jgi:hypothetical protein
LTSRQKPVFLALDPVAYIELVDELASRPETPAKRTAADRAYFAAFLFSRDQLTAKGYIMPHYSQDDRKYVAENLKLLLGTFGNQENRLRRARNRVTYDTRDLTQSEGQPPLSWMISTAKEIIERVKKLPPSPLKK